MSALTDFSLMDILFDKDGQIKFETKPEDIKIEDKSDDYWGNTEVDFLDSLLSQNLGLLPEDDDFLSQQPLTSISGSVYSDSGLSSDQQMSPVSLDECFNDQDLTNDVIIDPVGLNDADTPNLIKDLRKQEKEDVSVDGVTTPSRPVVRVKPVSRGLGRSLNLSLQNNSRSILIPVKGRNNLKTIKIIKAVNGRSGVKQRIERVSEDGRSSSDETSDEGDSNSRNYPRLLLTEEEKRLMVKEGITLPSRYPLTKQEERDLKRIRRKIRNKISAQDSRKRKKEYVDGLEDRVKQCSVENANLMRRVKALQSENLSLSAQVRKLQAVIARNSPREAQPATCLMVLVLSLALIMAPNMRGTSRAITQNDLSLLDIKSSPLGGPSRSLLESRKTVETGFQDFPIDGAEEEEDVMTVGGNLLSELAELLQFRRKAPSPVPPHIDHDYTNSRVRKRSREVFHVPPLDDDWPPPKKPTLAAPLSPLRPHFSPENLTVDDHFMVESPSNIVEIELSSDSVDGF